MTATTRMWTRPGGRCHGQEAEEMPVFDLLYLFGARMYHATLRPWMHFTVYP